MMVRRLVAILLVLATALVGLRLLGADPPPFLVIWADWLRNGREKR